MTQLLLLLLFFFSFIVFSNIFVVFLYLFCCVACNDLYMFRFYIFCVNRIQELSVCSALLIVRNHFSLFFQFFATVDWCFSQNKSVKTNGKLGWHDWKFDINVVTICWCCCFSILTSFPCKCSQWYFKYPLLLLVQYFEVHVTRFYPIYTIANICFGNISVCLWVLFVVYSLFTSFLFQLYRPIAVQSSLSVASLLIFFHSFALYFGFDIH